MAHLHIANAHGQNYTTFVETLRSLDGMRKRKAKDGKEGDKLKKPKHSTFCLHCSYPNHGIATCRLADQPPVSLHPKLDNLRQESKSKRVFFSRVKETLEIPKAKLRETLRGSTIEKGGWAQQTTGRRQQHLRSLPMLSRDIDRTSSAYLLTKLRFMSISLVFYSPGSALGASPKFFDMVKRIGMTRRGLTGQRYIY